MNRSIGIFGGTFDPVHRGHITLAQELQKSLQLDEMRLIPCRLPPHRVSPTASDQDRLQMLQLAIIGTSLSIDERELRREGFSYTIDTLAALREEYGNDCSLVLCMGMDVFSSLHTWQRWNDLLKLAHIVVMARTTNNELPVEVAKLLALHQNQDPASIKNYPAGSIYLTQLSQISVSSTHIRKELAEGKTTDDALLPAVSQFIQQRGLYLTR